MTTTCIVEGIRGAVRVTVEAEDDDVEMPLEEVLVVAMVEGPLLRNPNLIKTLPPTPIPARVVAPPPPEPSVIPNSRPRTLRTASSPLLSKTFKIPPDSCSKCSNTSVKVAVGGNVPVNLTGGSEHCNAIVIGLEATISIHFIRNYLLRR